jgi:hypothetical protein
LFETALTLSLVGLLTAAALTTIDATQATIESEFVVRDTEHAENALLGYAQVNAHLPAPEEATPSATRPGYVEGWLPTGVLGLRVKGPMRYIVEASLVDAPTPYDPDPLRLTNGRIVANPHVNGLDLCWQLMQIERAGTALPGGMRLGFGVQQAATRDSGTPYQADRIWLGDETPGTPPPGVRLGLRTKGPGEFASTLGCFNRFSQLGAGVRSTAAAFDLLRLARQETALRQLNLDLANDSLLNTRWRLINWSIAIEKFNFSLILEILSAKTTAVSGVTRPLNIISLGTAIAGTAWLLDVDRKGVEKGKVGVDKARAAFAAAQAHMARIQAEFETQARRAEQIQTEGLNP